MRFGGKRAAGEKRGGRFLKKRGFSVKHYVPDPAAARERAEWSSGYIARVLRIVQQEMEALAKPEHEYELTDKADELRSD